MGDYYFGGAITIERALGKDGITISSNTFKNYKGWSTASSTCGFYEFEVNPLVTFSMWLAYDSRLTEI